MTDQSECTPFVVCPDDNPQTLLDSFTEHGYLYLPQLLPARHLLFLREQFFQILSEHAWLQADASPESPRPCIVPIVEGDDAYFPVYDKIQKLEGFHTLAHDVRLLEVMSILLKGSAFPHPLSIARLIFPSNAAWDTPPHQDYPNNQGTEDLYACWMPLADCAMVNGPLAVLSGSQKFGVFPLEFSLGAGHRRAVIPEKLSTLRWHCSPMQAGDVLIFHSLALHKAMPNESDVMRLSVDYRYQKEGDPLTEQSLNPHFQRFDWSSVYHTWERKDLQYYWRDKAYSVVDWDSSYHELPEEHMKNAVKLSMQYDRTRQMR